MDQICYNSNVAADTGGVLHYQQTDTFPRYLNVYRSIEKNFEDDNFFMKMSTGLLWERCYFHKFPGALNILLL